jgi:hypothetical protein
MHDSMAALVTIEDPEGLEPVVDAYCALTEVHANYKTQSLVAIFECWRSREAFDAKRKSFTAIQVKFDTEQGGAEFFDRYGIDGSNGNVGANILEFCMANSDILKGAKPLDARVAEVSHE